MCQRPPDSQWAMRSQVRVVAAWAGVSTTPTAVTAASAATNDEMSMRKRMGILHTPSGLAVGFGLRLPGHHGWLHPEGRSRGPGNGGFPAPVLDVMGPLRPDRTRRDREAVPRWGHVTVGSRIGATPSLAPQMGD